MISVPWSCFFKNSQQDQLNVPHPIFNARGLKMKYNQVNLVIVLVQLKVLREVNDDTKMY